VLVELSEWLKNLIGGKELSSVTKKKKVGYSINANRCKIRLDSGMISCFFKYSKKKKKSLISSNFQM